MGVRFPYTGCVCRAPALGPQRKPCDSVSRSFAVSRPRAKVASFAWARVRFRPWFSARVRRDALTHSASPARVLLLARQNARVPIFVLVVIVVAKASAKPQPGMNNFAGRCEIQICGVGTLALGNELRRWGKNTFSSSRAKEINSKSFTLGGKTKRCIALGKKTWTVGTNSALGIHIKPHRIGKINRAKKNQFRSNLSRKQ